LGGAFFRMKIPGYPAIYDGARVTSEIVPFSDARIVMRDSVPDLPHGGGTSDAPPAAVTRVRLEQNLPNPFNPSTEIQFTVTQLGDVELAVFDVAGRRVRTLLRSRVPGGVPYRVRWDGTDEAGVAQPSGVYVYRLETPGDTQTRKMVLVR